MQIKIANKIELDDLNRYLQIRGLKSTAKKEELVARAFDGMKTEQNKSKKELGSDNGNKLSAHEYVKLLPDPNKVDDGLNE